MVKIQFTPLSLDRKICPFKKGFKKRFMTKCSYLWLQEPYNGYFCGSRGSTAQTFMALASTIFIVDPCIDIWGWSEGQGEQFGTHLGLLGPCGRYGYFCLHIWAGRGSEPVRRRSPETLPKVQAIYGATSGDLNSELIKALKKVCPPPLIFNNASQLPLVYIYMIIRRMHSHCKP